MNETPDHFFSGGPYLDVAVRVDLQDVVPVNTSSLLLEWESLLDPIAALREYGPELLARDEWLIDAWFAVPGWTTLDLIRQARSEHDVVQAFAGAKHTVRDAQTGWEQPIAELVTEEEYEHTLSNLALSVLLGLAVTTALYACMGKASKSLFPKLKTLEDAYRELS